MYGAYLPAEAAQARPRARLRRAADRPGRRVRLLRLAGDQGAARRRASPRSSSIRTSRPSRPARGWPTASTSSRSRRSSSSRSSSRRRSTPSCSRFGGQTALNCGLALDDARRARQATACGCSGTPIEAIRDTEDRELFVERLAEIGVKTARSRACRIADEARAAAREIGLPVMLRGGFALGGKGSGIVESEADARRRRCGAPSPAASPRCSSRSACGAGRRSSTRSCATRATTASPSATWRTSIRWASTPASRSSSRRRRRSTTRSTSCCARSRSATIRHLGIVGECNIQYALDPQGRGLPRHRGQRAALALERAGQQGDRLSARLRRREARARLRAAGDPERHHAAHHRLLRAGARLPRLQGAALGPRQVPRRLDAHRQRDEERRRGDGDRPHLPRGPPEGAAHARHRRARPRSGRVPSSRTCAISCGTPRRCASSPSRRRCATA